MIHLPILLAGTTTAVASLLVVIFFAPVRIASVYSDQVRTFMRWSEWMLTIIEPRDCFTRCSQIGFRCTSRSAASRAASGGRSIQFKVTVPTHAAKGNAHSLTRASKQNDPLSCGRLTRGATVTRSSQTMKNLFSARRSCAVRSSNLLFCRVHKERDRTGDALDETVVRKYLSRERSSTHPQ